MLTLGVGVGVGVGVDFLGIVQGICTKKQGICTKKQGNKETRKQGIYNMQEFWKAGRLNVNSLAFPDF